MNDISDIVEAHRHHAAEAAELLALDMEDDGPCTANDVAHALFHVEQYRVAVALALQAESLERTLAA